MHWCLLVLSGCCLFSFSFPSSSHALVISGSTHQGMEFTGRVLAVTEDELTVLYGEKTAATQITLPVQQVALVEKIHIGNREQLLTEIEPLTHLLSRFKHPLQGQIIQAVEQLIEEENWPLAFLWAERLTESVKEDGLSRQSRISLALCLYHLGYLERLRNELDRLNEDWDALSTPVLLCWLNARLADREGRLEDALYWAGLPRLRLPVEEGPLVDELTRFSEEKQNSPQYHPLLK